MLIATIKDEFGSKEPQSQAKPKHSSKFEEVIREAGVFGSEVHCQLHEGHLIIRGYVASYCQKQLAQEAVRVLPGVIEISNRLQVGCAHGLTPSCPPT